jgi:hypothetical protein
LSGDVYTPIKGEFVFKYAVGPYITGYQSSLRKLPSYLRVFISRSISSMIDTQKGNPAKQLKDLASKEYLDSICTSVATGEIIDRLDIPGSEELIEAELLRF